MPRFDWIFNNFSSGELSPLSLGRVDFARYRTGAKSLENWIVLLQGGIRTRYGTRYVATVKDSTQTTILLPFEPTTSTAYVMEVGDEYFRFYTDSAQLLSGGVPVEVTTPYQAADLRTLRTAQANDVMILAHGSYAPRKLSRLTTTTFSLQTITFTPPPTFEAGIQPAATLTPSAVTGSVTLTASAASFEESDVQRLVTSGTARAVITAYTSPTQVTATVLDDFDGLAAIAAGSWTIGGSPVARLQPDDNPPIGGQVTLDLQKEQSGASELVANGTFATALTSWTAGGGGDVTTGWHDGAGNSAVLEDSSQDFPAAGVEVGHRVFNLTDGSEGVVSVVTTTRLTLNPTLAGGTENDFDATFVSFLTGTDNSGVNNKATSMVDTTTNFVTAGVLVGMTIKNTTDGSEGVITSISTTTAANDTINFSGGLAGGVENDFDDTEAYDIGHPGDNYDVRDTGTAFWRDGKARIKGNTNGVGSLRQALTTVANTYYRLIFDVLTSSLSAMVGSTAGASDIVAEASHPIGNEHEIIFQATGVTTYIEFRNNQDTDADLDNVSCKIFSIDGFRTADAGKYLRINGGLIKITSITNARTVVGEVVAEMSSDDAAAIGAWSLESPSWADTLGWPTVVVLYEGRLYFAGSASFPQTIWGSAVDDLFNFFVGANDDDGMEFTIQDSGGNIVLNQIRALMPAENMLAMTTRAEYRLIGSGDDPLTPTSPPRVRVQSTYGSSIVPPLKVGPALLFVQLQGSALREMAFQEPTQGFISRNLSRLSGHLLRSQAIVEMAYQSEPEPIVWAIRDDGTLLGLTYDLLEEVEGWHRQTTLGSFESQAVIPHATAMGDQHWVIVNRTIGGATVRMVEYFDSEATMTYLTAVNGVVPSWKGLTVDSGVIYDFTGAPSAVLTGLTHLEGQSVVAVGDGAVFPAQAVAGGQITLSQTVTTAWAGLPFSCPGETPPLEVQINGTAQRSRKRHIDVTARVDNTIGLQAGGEQIPFRTPGMPMSEGVAPYTGDRGIILPSGWDLSGTITFSQTQPLPATILALISRVDMSAE